MLLLVGTLTVVAVLAATLFRWRQKQFSYFKTIGIPGPEPSFLWGNIREYVETDRIKVIDRWLEKYGDTFGFYNGDVPFIVTKDLDFLEFFSIHNFQNFTDRGVFMPSKSSFLGKKL
ncbi:putative cytochrome P450 cyp-13B1 [Amblyomma americanum]